MDTGTILTTYTESNISLPYRRYLMYATCTMLYTSVCCMFGYEIERYPWYAIIGAILLIFLLVLHPRIFRLDNPKSGFLKYVVSANTPHKYLFQDKIVSVTVSLCTCLGYPERSLDVLGNGSFGCVGAVDSPSGWFAGLPAHH
jgi:hypothetical protein